MLIGNSNSTSKQMDVLIGLVIAMFVITAAFVGYHASQESVEESKGHDFVLELELFGDSSKSIQTLQKYDFSKSII